MKHIIKEKHQNILEALGALFPDTSKNNLRSWLKEGRVHLDDKVVKEGKEPVSLGQSIEIKRKERALNCDLRILYEDKHLVVIYKPEGLLSVATAFETELTAHAILKERYRPGRAHVIHRLDQDTSGVMLFARTESARDQLKDIFSKHAIEREYCAIVEGQVPSPTGTWSSYQYEDANYVVHTTQNPNKGKLAITHYKRGKVTKKYSWLHLELETGRKNQIRVHCAEAGHPIIGDKKYGAKSNPIKRIALHAHSLGFIHPITKKKMHFSAPVPESFTRLMGLV